MQEKTSNFAIIFLNRLKSALNINTDTELGIYLGIKQNTISSWKKRNTFDFQLIITKCDKISLDWLVTGKGSMMKGAEPETIRSEGDSTFNIPLYNDIQVAAGAGIYNAEPVEPDSTLSLPQHLLKRSAQYICTRVRGESMSPTIQDSSYIISRLLDKGEWQFMPDEHIYIVVSKEGQSFVKRIKNRFDQGFIVLMSDNPDKHTYGNFNLMSNEVQHIWHAEWYVSARMPNIHDQFYSRLKRLEDKFDQFENQLTKN